MSAYTEAMIALAEMLPEQGDDPRLRAIANEVGKLTAEVEALRRESRKWEDGHAALVIRALAAEAEVERLAAAENEVDARLEAAEARIGVLEGALDGVWCAMSSKGEKCWCAYERIIHPQDDPQDALTLEPNGHTKECNTARSALGGGEGEK